MVLILTDLCNDVYSIIYRYLFDNCMKELIECTSERKTCIDRFFRYNKHHFELHKTQKRITRYHMRSYINCCCSDYPQFKYDYQNNQYKRRLCSMHNCFRCKYLVYTDKVLLFDPTVPVSNAYEEHIICNIYCVCAIIMKENIK